MVPIPEDMQKTGVDAGVLHLPELQEKIEKALEPFHYTKPAIARINGSDIYFVPEIYDRLKQDRAAMQTVLDAALAQPGVAAVYRAEELQDRPSTQSPTHEAMANSYFPGRSGDLFVVPKPYWLMDGTAGGQNAYLRHGPRRSLQLRPARADSADGVRHPARRVSRRRDARGHCADSGLALRHHFGIA